MNYFEYLNKLSSGTNRDNFPKVRVNNNNTNPFMPLFGDAYSVRYNGMPIFSKATKTDIENVDYTKLTHTNEEAEQPQELSPLEYVLKNFFSIEAVKKLADSNADGELSVKELKEYVKELAGKDGNLEDISLEDFEAVLKENNIDLDKILEELASETETPVETPDEPSSAVDETTTSAPVEVVPASVSSNSGNSYNVSTSKEKTLDEMSMDELETERTSRASNVTEKQKAVNAVHNGENEKVKAAKKCADVARAEYEKAIKEDAGAKKFAKLILTNNSNIEKNRQKLDKNAVEINNKEVEIANMETSLEGLKGNLAALKTSLSSIPALSGKPEDKEKDAKIKSRKSELEKQISSKTKEISKQEHKLAGLKKSLEKLQKEKENLEKEKQSLNTEKTKLDELVKQNCSEVTKAKLDAFNRAKQNVEDVKSRELQTAKSELQDAQGKLKEVDVKIAEVKNTPKKFTFNELDIESIPADVRKRLGAKIAKLPDGTEVLTFNYTKLDQMKKEFTDKIPEFQRIAGEMGLTFVISDGSRSVAESNAARARKGNSVAKGGSSPHNYGVAIDIALYKDGKQVSGTQFNEFARRVKAETGVTWGGDWGSFGRKYETQHFELANWRSKYKNQDNLIYNHVA